MPLTTVGSVRCLGGLNRWDEELTNDIRKEVEKHWNGKVLGERFDENSDKEKFYVLSMFPYPSGALHMGHIRVYSIGDVIARYHRMRGKNVIHPMGWDAFGLPAENAALERGIDPDEWTQSNIAHMKSLMEKMNFSFDWNREFATCDSDYYKWTQFFFLKLYEKGLVYRKEAAVNWDPVDQTVLADEQVDESGRSWRSGALVEKKMLRQWFVRTTQFSKSLYDGLNDPILEDWKDVTDIQRHWIGKVNGTTINFQILDDIGQEGPTEMPVWLGRPEYIDRSKFVAVKPKSLWTFGSDGEENGRLPYRVKNPFTNEPLPVFATEEVPYPDGSDVCLGIPDLSDAEKQFAASVGIPYSPGLQKVASKEELLNLRHKICSEAQQRNLGGYPTSSKLQDWLISRQRYWGTPIPITYCKECGEQPVPERDLPVKLPKVKSIKLGSNPLKEAKDWYHVACPKCGGDATRETDTMDTFVDSSWYYLRYLDPDNEQAAFDAEKAMKLMPVDVYVGGKEHATLHLYFARFVNHFLNSVGLVPEREPFRKLLCQGMVKGQTYRSETTGKYLKPDEVDVVDNRCVHRDTGESVLVDWEKMSKSKHNGVEPSRLLDEYGVDATRLTVLAEAAPRSDLNWDEKSFKDIQKWQHRLWLTVAEFIRIRSKNLPRPEKNSEDYEKMNRFLYDNRNFYLKKVTSLLENSFSVSIAIAKMQGLTSALRRSDETVVAFSPEYEKCLAIHIIMLAPFTPAFASELWSGFVQAPNRLATDETVIAWSKPVIEQSWPTVDEGYSGRSEEVAEMLNIKKAKSKKERKEEKRMKKLARMSGSGDD